MSHLHFEPTIDVTCVTALFDIVRNKQLVEQRTEALDHAFFLAGSLNAWFAKDENHDPEAFGSVAVPNEMEGEGALLERLEAELGKAVPVGSSNSASDNPLATKNQAGAVKMNEVLAMLLKKLVEYVLSQLM